MISGMSSILATDGWNWEDESGLEQMMECM